MPVPELLPDLGERYTVLKSIGAGGMGRVYLALDTQHDRRVAIKLLDPRFSQTVGSQRFLQEIKTTAGLSHPSIVPLFDSGTFDAQLFYVMPYIEGESLRQRLKRDTMLPVDLALRWASEVCEGLTFAHAQGVVHRDIKPENLLIHADHLLIADFGIARAIDLAGSRSIMSEQVVLGTMLYMSPEQASGATQLDGRTDVFALACVVYEMLVGEPPFVGPNAQIITARKLAGQYHRIRSARPMVPAALERVLAHALAPLPADRIGSPKEFSTRLLAAGKPKAARLVAGLVAAAVLGAAGWMVAHRAAGVSQPIGFRQRVVIARFENRTGDPRYDALGFMAADWATEGLQRTGAVDVVPSATALAATKYLKDSGGGDDPVRSLARETGANLVVNGSIYRDGPSLVFQAQLVNAEARRLIGAVEPVRSNSAAPVAAIQQLRIRLMGLLSVTLDDRMFQGERTPTYVAYQGFSDGMDAYVWNDYAAAAVAFEHAYAADTSFPLALLYASLCHTNLGDYHRADSLLHIVSARRARLTTYDRDWLDYRVAQLAGNDAKALAAIRHASELAPTSKATYNFAVQALEARQPFQAESALRSLSPDVGSMRGWFPYWDVLASALHVQGKHAAELKVAHTTRQRFPTRIASLFIEARALSAERRASELERLWHDASTEGDATPLRLGSLALETGSELWAHGDSTTASMWFTRAFASFATPRDSSQAQESRWGEARAAARLGRLREALALATSLARHDSSRLDYAGLAGVLYAELGDRAHASAILEQLAQGNEPFTWGGPQFEAGRIAAVLGDFDRATSLLTRAYDKGIPYGLDLHRDPYLAGVRGTAIGRQLAAHIE